MNLTDLLAELSARGARVWTEDGRLRLRAPKDALTPELKAALSGHKAELLELLGEQSAGLEQAKPLEPRAGDGPARLSFMQERLWFLWQMYPRSAVYNLPNARRMRGPVDVDALRAAVGEIIQRHEALRTVCPVADGEPQQHIVDRPEVLFEVVDLSSEEDPVVEADRLATLEAAEPFDLTNGPPIRAKLLRLGEEDHLFLWSLHHAVSDGWSSILFLRELKALYEAEVSGSPADLPRPEVQFADFAEWERTWMDGEVLERHLSYWREKLRGAPTSVLELPSDHRRPPVLSYRGQCRPLALPSTLVEALRSLAQEAGVTLYTALLTSFKILLARQTGQTDICVGSPIARRNRPELESVIGCFVNTLVLRTDLSDDPSVLELLGRVRTVTTEAFAHQDVPIEKLIDELQPPRDTGHTPLFQVMFTLHVQDSRKVSSIGDVSIEPVEYHAPTSKFDLTLELKETAQGLEGWFEYSTDLFEPSTIDRLAEQFTTLLEGIVAAPETRTSKLPLLPAEERRRVLGEWNRTDQPYPEDALVHDLIGAQVSRTPDRAAVEIGDKRLSYGELERRSNQLARVLRSLGVGKGSCVGLCTDRSTEMVVGLLGIMKAGGAYVPLDPSFPADRLAFMARDAQLSVLVTESGLRELVPDLDARVLELDGHRSQIEAESGDPLDGVVGPEDLAYVIYTSGSTGQPKGVQIEHHALVNFLCSMKAEPGLGEGDRLLAVTTLSFDIAGLELYLPLISGGTVVLASSEEASDGERLAGLIAGSGATVMQATPSTWRMLLEAGWGGSETGLKVLCGGEALPKELADRLLLCGAEVWNLYGPTETTIWSAAHRVEASDERVFVGRPIANTTLYLLDEHGEPVPTGVPGELYIGGDGVARGYLGREDLTRERFVASPFGTGGGRLYRTGDLARYHSDGKLEVLGRLDHQVKVRGFRIELGEVEAVLADHAGVREAVVVAREYGAGDERLVAYLVPGTDAPDAQEVRAHAKLKLPDYMVPAVYVELEALPLTPNGKIDRKALPEPEGVVLQSETEHVAPRTKTEALVASVWADLLKVEQVGVHDSFFDLGGHSLLAIRLVSRLEEATGRKVPPVEVFRGGTVEHLAQWLDGVEKNDWGAAASMIRQGGSLPPFFAIGSNHHFVEVARHVDRETPFYRLDVYALQSERVDEGNELYQTIEEIASRLVESIRSIEPEGPYYLGGACEGAFVAFEAARQLQAAGEEIASLVLWFSYSPDRRRAARRSTALPAKGVRRLRKLLRRSFMGRRTTKSLVRHERLRQRTFRAMDAYRPETPFRGRLSLIQTIENELALKDLTFGWQDLATEGATVRTMEGNHLLILRERPDEFGGHLEAFLQEARAAQRGLEATREIA